MLAAIPEVFAHRAPRVRRDVLHCRGSRRRRIHDDRVCHRIEVFKRLLDLGYRRFLLADRNIDANQVGALRIYDRIDRNRSLTGLTIADYQLSLSAPDGHHRIDGLQPGHHRFANRLAIHDARRDALKRTVLSTRVDRTTPVKFSTERIHYAPDQLVAAWNRHDSLCSPYLVAFLDLLVSTKQHGSNLVLFEVQGDSRNLVRKIQQLAGHDSLEAVYLGDAVACLNHSPNFGDLNSRAVALDLLSY